MNSRQLSYLIKEADYRSNKAGIEPVDKMEVETLKAGEKGSEQSKIVEEKVPREVLVARMRSVDSALVQEKPLSGLGAAQGLVDMLRKQIEFYFGDPNLKRDRHLRELIAKHKKGYVELKTLLTFNRISHLFANAHVTKLEDKMASLRQAVSSSQILKICKQKLRVKRIIPFSQDTASQKEVVDEVTTRTVYIENIPPHATVDIIARVFSKFGQLALVNVPKADHSSHPKNKGFAFVEFSVLST